MFPPDGKFQWIPEMKRVQAAGKGLTVGVGSGGAGEDEMRPLLRELSPEGLLLTSRSDSEEKEDTSVQRGALDVG